MYQQGAKCDTQAVIAPHVEQSADRPVTVADVLALPRLVEAEAELVAGSDGLEREVTWVHAAEISDIARYLRGGELLLTAGTGIGRAPADRTAYIEALAEAGASALVIEYGRAFRSVPPELRSAANRLGLPLATLLRNVPFAEVTRSVHGWIIGRQYALRSRVEQIALDFNDLLLSGGSIAQVLHKLHEITGKTAVLEDAAHQLVEFAGADRDLEGLVSDWATHSRTGHRHGATLGDAPPQPDVEDGTCAWAPVVLRGEPWGRVHVVSADGIDELDGLAAQRASSAIGIALLNHHHHARLTERVRADLLDEAARRAPEDPSSFLRQARSVGADFRGRTLVALEAASADVALGSVATAATLAAQEAGLSALSSYDATTCRLLVGVPEDDDLAATARIFASRLVDGLGGDERVVLGISRASTVPMLPQAFHEARECLRFARVSGAGGVLEYANLGLHLLLASLADGPALARFVETELGPLLDHDARARSPLLPTLRALLAYDSNRAEAARALHVERRSIYYRLQRIEEVLGQSLDDADVKLALGVALRALSLIEDRSVARDRR